MGEVPASSGVPVVCCPCCSLVIETLKDMEPGRKCFRLVGGVLVERTVQEVLPALRSNAEKVRHNPPTLVLPQLLAVDTRPRGAVE